MDPFQVQKYKLQSLLAFPQVFLPEEDGGCKIDFFVEFEFRSKLLESMIGALFHEAVTRMVEAFERRADSLYGSK